MSPLVGEDGGGIAKRKVDRPIPRIAVTKDEAAAMLGMSVGSLNKYVMPDVKVIRRGKIVLIPVKQLDAWADRAADYTL